MLTISLFIRTYLHYSPLRAGLTMAPMALGIVIGLGMAGVFAPLFDVILAGVSDEESGSASGTLTAMQQLAGAIGVAGVTTVFLSLVKQHTGPDAMAFSTVVVSALILVALGLVFLLPKQVRE